MNKTLLIMAAGSGSRYGALKQFDDLGPSGEFLFEFAIFDAILQGFDAVVLITREAYVDELQDYLSQRLPPHIRLKVLAQRMDDLPVEPGLEVQRSKPWGTAHAVWAARDEIKGPFVVMNADDFYGRRSFELAREFIDREGSSGDFGLVPFSLRQTLSAEGGVTRAICVVEKGYLHHIEECHSIVEDKGKVYDQKTGREFQGDEVTSMNFWIFNPKVFDLIRSDLKAFISDQQKLEKEELYIPSQAQIWISEHKARVKLTPSCSDWFGVTYANDRDRAVRSLKRRAAEGDYPHPLWS